MGVVARWGKVNYRQLQQLQQKLDKLEKADTQKFCEECAKELAARLLAKVIKRTPVGQYEEAGKVGGTLRRGWTAATETEAAGGQGNGRNGTEYAKSLSITKVGNIYQVEIINLVHYASYVEFGHRTRDHKGWVQGKFMMTISEDELERQAPAILEKKLLKYLGDAFNAD